MTRVLNPLTSELQARHKIYKIKEVLIKGTKFSLLIGLPICTVFLIMGNRFISLWMGPEYAETSGKVLVILTITHLFSIAQYTTGNILYGINRHNLAAYCHAIEAIANLALSIILVRSWGIVGVAIGTAIPHLIIATIVFPVIISKVVHLKFWDYMRLSYLPPFIAAVPFLAACHWINNQYPAETLPIFFAEIAFILPLYLVIVWFVSFRKKEREEYTAMLLRFVPALNKR